ncbi:MAG: efflux RND transporter periplasmic adaptor subunit [Cypionkella sp.]|nr:efflux RND transporter periplasmic adaptor subunit [Cypionkella sp.]
MRSSSLFLILATALTPALTGPAFAQETAAAVLPSITVSATAQREMRDTVIASGLIVPAEEVQIFPMVQGQQIAELLVDVGDRVTAGQVLARLSSSAYSLQQSQLKAAVDAAKSAGQDSAALEAELATVTKDLARAQLTLRQTDIKSPVAGEVSARSAELGAMAGASALPMFTIIRDGILELQADVSESDLLRLAAGQKAEMTVVGADAPLSGAVRLVEPTVNAATRLGRLRISVDDATRVRAGMFVEAGILVAQRSSIAVPVTAIGRFDGSATVMVISQGEAKRRPVKTGIREGGWIEILDGLTAGETIVTKAGSFVRDGDKINPILETSETK